VLGLASALRFGLAVGAVAALALTVACPGIAFTAAFTLAGRG
jgi:hypothetical protein